MNYKYRKKPIVIEAFQMTEHRRWHSEDWPEWLHCAWNMDKGSTGSVWCDPDNEGKTLVCATLEGVMRISQDDWIIQGVRGEIYSCKPNVFEATYEAEPGSPPANGTLPMEE